MILYGHCIRGIGSLTAAYASGLPVIDQGRVATRSDVWGPRCPLAFTSVAHSTQLTLIMNSGSAKDWVPDLLSFDPPQISASCPSWSFDEAAGNGHFREAQI